MMERLALVAACALAASCSHDVGLEGGADAALDAGPDAVHDTIIEPGVDVEPEPSGPCDDYVGLGTPEEIAATPREDVDAELLALGLADGLTADPGTYARVAGDLALMREMDPTIAHIRVFGQDGKTFSLEFDAPTMVEVREDAYEGWLCPNEHYVLEDMYISHYSSWVSLTLKGIYNIELVAEEYAGLPGVTYVEFGIWVGDGPTICLTAEGELHHYVFDDAHGDCPAGCMYHRYVYFTTLPGDPPVRVGEWSTETGYAPPPWIDAYGRCP
jgi:hypothetical protein